MKKLPLILFLFAVVVGVAYYGINRFSAFGKEYKNAPFTIEGSEVRLVDGIHSVPITADSTTSIVTRYFGNETFGDLNGDGVDDVAFLVTQSGGGSGTFYYVVATLKEGGEYHGTNAVFLGDRVAPQPNQIQEGVLFVHYADRMPNEPMTAVPSIGVSRSFHVEEGVLSEIR